MSQKTHLRSYCFRAEITFNYFLCLRIPFQTIWRTAKYIFSPLCQGINLYIGIREKNIAETNTSLFPKNICRASKKCQMLQICHSGNAEYYRKVLCMYILPLSPCKSRGKQYYHSLNIATQYHMFLMFGLLFSKFDYFQKFHLISLH